jgi:hypothetical protein
MTKADDSDHEYEYAEVQCIIFTQCGWGRGLSDHVLCKRKK